ncbi:Zinc finger protein ZPR1 [Hondaea fermentalgiana]|uniref:Zinc finger protein ZPR1 n=1 Tax=Hondaea fermentalgiana TaxID=2315210 RepID=A0A2R5GSA8_9STRA|nr:Zinc finger protein ZPR1 [Hondaea fermentalgiana]|eukprot:GBG33766.1 Zinc finger protein ZPR1 [Hondaea fermentalgiana]
MEDHPDVDRSEAPSRVDLAQLTPAQLEALAQGEAVEFDAAELENAQAGADASAASGAGAYKVFKDEDNQLELDDVVKLAVSCLECGATADFQRAELNLPRFGRAEIQSFSCSGCGYTYRKVRSVDPIRTADVAPLEPGYGRRIILNVQDESDLSREVLRSDDCTFRVPELELEVSTRAGAMTTVEGCLQHVGTSLRFLRLADDAPGEGASATGNIKMANVVDARVEALLDGVRNGTSTFQLILEDEHDASHIQVLENDSRVSFEVYLLDSDSEAADEEAHPAVLCGLTHVEPGVVLEAMYGEEWIPNCRVVSVNGSAVWVERADDPGDGRWHAGLDEVRGCEDPSCGCQQLLEMPGATLQASAAPDMEMLDYLNKFADHVEAQEGSISTQQKKQMNAQAQIAQDLDALDQMD